MVLRPLMSAVVGLTAIAQLPCQMVAAVACQQQLPAVMKLAVVVQALRRQRSIQVTLQGRDAASSIRQRSRREPEEASFRSFYFLMSCFSRHVPAGFFDQLTPNTVGKSTDAKSDGKSRNLENKADADTRWIHLARPSSCRASKCTKNSAGTHDICVPAISRAGRLI